MPRAHRFPSLCPGKTRSPRSTKGRQGRYRGCRSNRLSFANRMTKSACTGNLRSCSDRSSCCLPSYQDNCSVFSPSDSTGRWCQLGPVPKCHEYAHDSETNAVGRTSRCNHVPRPRTGSSEHHRRGIEHRPCDGKPILANTFGNDDLTGSRRQDVTSATRVRPRCLLARNVTAWWTRTGDASARGTAVRRARLPSC